MNNLREMKRKARIQLHDRMSDPALYLATPTATPLGVSVRLHLSFGALGELLRGGFGEREELTPRIIFMGSQVSPVRNAIVVTQDMGAFRVDNTMPPDDISITAEVIKLTHSQCVTFGWNPELQYMGLVANAESVNPDSLPSRVLVTKGDPGKSAYEVWLDQGNTGTEEDFFEAINPKLTVGTAPPASPEIGDLWVDTN
jgi:hypothetical protein